MISLDEEITECLLPAIDVVLVCGGTNTPSSVELIAYKRHDSCKGDRNIISDHSHEPHEACFDLLQPQAYCDTPLPIPLFFGHTVTRIGKGTVLAIGGVKELVDDNGWGNAWDGDDELGGLCGGRVTIDWEGDCGVGERMMVGRVMME